MKKYVLFFAPLILAACTTPTQQSTVPMDMQAVEDYRQRVINHDTVSATAAEDEKNLNYSSHHQKRTVYHRQPVIYPTVGFHYGYHHHRHHRYWY